MDWTFVLGGQENRVTHATRHHLVEQTMRALSVRQPWAELIARGEKTIEYRTWCRNFRGDLLIVASKSRNDDECRAEGFDPDTLVYGAAVCVVDLYDVTGEEGDFEWHVRNPRRVEAAPITGFASVYNVADDKIVLIDPAAFTPVTRGERIARLEDDEGDDDAAEQADEDADDEDADSEEPPCVRVLIASTGARAAYAAQCAVQALGTTEGVRVTQDGQEAWDTIIASGPDLLLVSSGLYELSGLEVLQKLFRSRGVIKPAVMHLEEEAGLLLPGVSPIPQFDLVDKRAAIASIQQALKMSSEAIEQARRDAEYRAQATREIFSVLAPARIAALCPIWLSSTPPTLEERRDALGDTFGADLEAAIVALTKADLTRVFAGRKWVIDGTTYLAGAAASRSKDELGVGLLDLYLSVQVPDFLQPAEDVAQAKQGSQDLPVTELKTKPELARSGTFRSEAPPRTTHGNDIADDPVGGAAVGS